MKDNGFPAPRWELLSPAAAPPIITFDLISRMSHTDSQNSSSPGLGQQHIGDMCSPEGQWNCMTTSWQRCASGTWSVVVPCATGTICQPFGLTDYITIEYEATANDGRTDDGRSSSDDNKDGKSSGNYKSGKNSFGLRNTPSLVLLFTAFATGVSWSFLM